jgi:acylphosphatase
MMPEASVNMIVHGRVQGVGFRDYTERQARSLGLVGRVRNLSDGTVEVEAEGDRALLLRLAERVRRGPPASRVDDLNLSWGIPTGRFTSFEIGI